MLLLIGINILVIYWLWKGKLDENKNFIKPILIIILMCELRIYTPLIIGLINYFI